MSTRSGPRKRLWEVPGKFLCSVIGTCLTLTELRKLASKAKLSTLDLTDYDLHGLMVRACAQRSPASRSVHKLLERKYGAAVRGFANATSETQVGAAWSQALESGQVAGAYWALMTHPATTPRLIELAFGDIHMLSHLQGASRRADLQHLERALNTATLERDKAKALHQAFRRERALLEASRARVSQLEICRERLERRSAEDRERLAASTDGQRLRALQDQVDQLRQQLHAERCRAEAAERTHRVVVASQRRTTQQLQRLEHERELLLAESVAADEHVRVLLSALGVGADGCEGCPARANLNGKCVLYVGGRTGLVPHYRDVVERSGGTFMHHDGGVEERKARLDTLVGSAAFVVCPVDAVSHDACLRVKRACKRGVQHFVPLRTAGVTSLIAALDDLGAAEAAS